MEMDEILKNRLKKERLKLNIEQKDLASKLGISNRTISKYELGQAKPSYEILSGLADIFSCSVDYLIGRTDDRNSSIFHGTVDGESYEFMVSENEPDKPDTEEKFNRLVRKLKAVGFDVEKLMEEHTDIDLNKD